MYKACFVIVNPYCHQGQGWRRWLSLQDEVMANLPEGAAFVVLEKGLRLEDILLPKLQRDHHTLLISAGGDGSVHFLINTLLQANVPLDKLAVGAIGLGSSNDFLKPFKNRVKNIPVRMDYRGPIVWHDVGQIRYQNEEGVAQKRYFIINASLGVTAAANWNFNHPDRVLGYLKAHFTHLAILYTAVKTILTYRNEACELFYNGLSQQVAISNVNILKIPHVSGSLYYPQKILPDDGQLGLNLCLGMSKWELLQILDQLGKGRFDLGKKTFSTYTQSIEISAAEPRIFECDGETDQSRHLEIQLVPKAIPILLN